MTLEELVSKYIRSSKDAFESLEIADEQPVPTPESIRNILRYAKNYLDDAVYYKDKKKYDVSLTSVAYCEGMLDALRLLGTVDFEWRRELKERREKRC